MSRQDEFKEELFDLLRRYKVEMSVVEDIRSYGIDVIGINFWSYTQHVSRFPQRSPRPWRRPIRPLEIGRS